MALLTCQVLFATPSDHEVAVDVIVLDAAPVEERPEIGTPLGFVFELPGDDRWRASLANVIERWAETCAIVDIDVVQRAYRTRVRFTSLDTTVVLDPPRHHV